MKSKHGFSLAEILIVIVIVGILGTVGYVSSSSVKTKQQEHAAIEMVRKSVALAATGSSARGQRLSLVYVAADNELQLRDQANTVLEKFRFPNTVTTNLDNGDRLEFTPLGWVDSGSLSGSGGFPNPLAIYTPDKTYNLSITLIGEIKVD